MKPLDLDHTNQSWFWSACWGQLLGLVPVPVPVLVLAPMLGAVLVLVPDPVLALVVTKMKSWRPAYLGQLQERYSIVGYPVGIQVTSILRFITM